jgi:hypothetical protein
MGTRRAPFAECSGRFLSQSMPAPQLPGIIDDLLARSSRMPTIHCSQLADATWSSMSYIISVSMRTEDSKLDFSKGKSRTKINRILRATHDAPCRLLCCTYVPARRYIWASVLLFHSSSIGSSSFAVISSPRGSGCRFLLCTR